MIACSQPVLTVTRLLKVSQRKRRSQVAASNVSSIDIVGKALILSCRSGGCRYCRQCWEAYLEAEDLLAVEHEDSIGDLEAGVDRGSTLLGPEWDTSNTFEMQRAIAATEQDGACSEELQSKTEARQRGSFHSHTLCWFKRKLRPKNWEPLPPISATRQGATAKQRSITAKPLLKLTTDEFQEDSLYQLSEIARISGEMPRPDVSTTSSIKWGGYDWDSLRIAGLARGVLTKLNYMHVCTPASCLLNRASCRFFFPWCVAFETASLSTRKLFANHLHVVCFKGHWPQQPYQVYDENTQRLALRRQLCDDDQWVTQ